MIITMKQGAIALASLAGFSGGYTLKENFWQAQRSQSCIASMVEEGAGNVRYFNSCARPINAMICEEYNLQYGWFGEIARGSKSCSWIQFDASAERSMPKADRVLTNIIIRECDGDKKARWISNRYECTLDNI